ncbi:MAG: acylphosphatase [Nostocoides sp.]
MPRLPNTPAGPPSIQRVTVFVRGRVQGVGFRWWTRTMALELGLTGHARNTADGRVEVVAEGSRQGLEILLQRLGESPSTQRRPGRVELISAPQWDVARGVENFLER